MSDFKRKTGLRSPFADVDGNLLIRAPWLDDSASIDVWASMGGKPVQGLGDDKPADQKAQARTYAEIQKKRGKRVKNPGWKRPAKSLEWLARRLNKSTRTVRRYCEIGLVPGAYRTKGGTGGKGHWRVKRGWRDVKAVRRAIDEFGRASKTKREREADVQRNLAGRLMVRAHHANAFAWTAGAYTDQDNKNEKRLPDDALLAAKENQRMTRLVTVAKHLAKDGGKITAKALAVLLEISRATLFRRYSSAEMRAAKKAAQEFSSDTDAPDGSVRRNGRRLSSHD